MLNSEPDFDACWPYAAPEEQFCIRMDIQNAEHALLVSSRLPLKRPHKPANVRSDDDLVTVNSQDFFRHYSQRW